MSDHQQNPFPPRVRPTSADDPAVSPTLFPTQPIPGEETALFMPNPPGTEPEKDPPHRIPHLGHALLFVALSGFLLLLTQLLFLGPHLSHASTQTELPPKLLMASEAVTYLITLVISWFLFPLFWKRSFPDGIEANPAAARRNALRLIPTGLVLSFTVQAASSLATLPKDIPMDDFFRTPTDVWLITAFGTLVAPLFEEILFRGFLLPAFAIAYDWLSLPRTPAAREQWNSTNRITIPALVFSAVLTSILFTALHGQQVSYAWPVLILLFCVSLVLTFVRIRLRSVAASALVHASYNLTIFLTAFIATDGYRHLDKMTR